VSVQLAAYKKNISDSLQVAHSPENAV